MLEERGWMTATKRPQSQHNRSVSEVRVFSSLWAHTIQSLELRVVMPGTRQTVRGSVTARSLHAPAIVALATWPPVAENNNVFVHNS